MPAMPVYTAAGKKELDEILSPLVSEIKASFDLIFDKCLWLLVNHTPKALKEQVPAAASIYMGGNIFKNVLKSMFSQKLLDFSDSECIPTAYMVLK